MVTVPDRTVATLHNDISALPGLNHVTVNHSLNFVDSNSDKCPYTT